MKNSEECGFKKTGKRYDAGICHEKAHGSPSGYCVFHAPIEEKTPKDFWEAFKLYLNRIDSAFMQGNARLKKVDKYDFAGFIFPEQRKEDIAIFFRDFEHLVWFNGARFTNRIIFAYSKFKNTVSFAEAKFMDDVVFLRAQLISANFVQVEFKGELSLRYTEVLLTGDFSDVVFRKKTDFGGTKFLALEGKFTSTNLSGARFYAEAIFSSCYFEMPFECKRVLFKAGAVFHRAEFKQGVDFTGTHFSGELKKKTRTVYELEYFKRMIGEKFSYVNPSVIFTVDFERAIFSNESIFLKTIFGGNVNFTLAKFDGDVRFYLTEIYGSLYYLGTAFNGELSFVCVTLTKGAYFWRCEIYSDVEIATVGAAIRKLPACYKIEPGGCPELYFNAVELIKDGRLIIRNTDLGNSSFAETLALPDFLIYNVTWDGGTNRGRKHTKDEDLAERGDISYDDAAEVYRRLRRNFENRLAYEEASGFHIGQMEMMLKNPKLDVAKSFFLRLYKWASNYGENVMRPLYWLGFITVMAALALLITGFPETDESIKWELVKPINAAVFDWRAYWVTQLDGIKAAWFAFTSLISFRTDPGLTFKGAAIIKTVYRIFSYSLGTLFLLVLRRAFRR